MYRVTFTVCERIEAVLFIEEAELNQAFDPSAPGQEISAEPLTPEEVRAIPSDFVGHLLYEEEAAELDLLLIAAMPKKPPASSIFRRVGGKVRQSARARPG
jgi:hypothetical protein